MRGVLLCLMGYACFSINDALRKYLVQNGYDVFTITFWASFFALAGMLSIAGKLGGLRETFRTKQPRVHFIRSLFMAINMTLAVYAFGHLPMVDAYTLIFLSPFVVALFSFLIFGEPLSIARVIAIIVGFAGVLIVLQPGLSVITWGHAAALGVAFFYSFVFLLAKKLGLEETKLSLSLFPYLALFGLSLIMTKAMPTIPTLPDFCLFLLIGILSIVAMTAMSLAFATTPGALLGPLHYTQLLWGVLLGFFVFGDVPGGFTILGAAVIIAAGLYLLWQEGKNVTA